MAARLGLGDSLRLHGAPDRSGSDDHLRLPEGTDLLVPLTSPQAMSRPHRSAVGVQPLQGDHRRLVAHLVQDLRHELCPRRARRERPARGERPAHSRHAATRLVRLTNSLTQIDDRNQRLQKHLTVQDGLRPCRNRQHPGGPGRLEGRYEGRHLDQRPGRYLGRDVDGGGVRTGAA